MLSESPRPGPGEAINAPPGSELKIRVMIERAARREPLFHPLDGSHCVAASPPSREPWWRAPLPEDPLEVPELFEEELAVPVVTVPETDLEPAELGEGVLETVGPL